LPRCIDSMGDALPHLLSAAIQGRSVSFETTPEVAADAGKLCNAASILSLMQTSDTSNKERETMVVYRHVLRDQEDALLPIAAPQDQLASELDETEELLNTWRQPLRLKQLDSGKYQLSGNPWAFRLRVNRKLNKIVENLPSEFCNDWARNLREKSKSSPLLLRHVLEDFKNIVRCPLVFPSDFYCLGNPRFDGSPSDGEKGGTGSLRAVQLLSAPADPQDLQRLDFSHAA